MDKWHGRFFGLVVLAASILSTFWFFPESAVAAPIINSIDRMVVAESFSPLAVILDSSKTTGTWDVGVGLGNQQDPPGLDVTQTSTIDASSPFQAEGSVFTTGVYTEDQKAVGRSSYIVDFSLSASHAYTLSGTSSVNMDGGYALAGFSLEDNSTNLFVHHVYADQTNGNMAFSLMGVLDAGRYVLTIEALLKDSGLDNSFPYGGSADYNLSLALTEVSNNGVPEIPPVPEPSTMLLLGSGLMGLAWYGRKRKK